MIGRKLSLVERAWTHPLVRQISGMMALTVVGQGLYLLAGPFIGRFYSPEQIGFFGLFVTMWAVLALFACGLYDLAIPGARDDDEARRLSGASALLGAGIGLVSGGAVSLAAAEGWFGFGVLPVWVGGVMIVGMLAQTVVLIGQGWAIRREQVLVIGQANVLMNGLRSILQVLGGLLSPVWVTMVAGEIVARLAQAHWIFKGRGPGPGAFLAWDRIGETIRNNRRFPFIFGPAYILDSSAGLLQTAMFGLLFGPAEMGQFFLMRRTLDLPVAFAFRSLSDLFLARQLVLAREAPARLRPFFLKSAAMLMLIGLASGAPLLFWGSELFQLFYGDNWGTAGMLAAIMVPPMVLNLAVAPVSRIFQLTNKAYLRIFPSLVNIVGTLLVLWVAEHYALGLTDTVFGISLVICVQYAVYFIVGYHAAGHVTPGNALPTQKMD